MRSAVRAASVVGTAALVLGGLTATEASAAEPYCITNLHPLVDIITGKGCFVPVGDDIRVTDTYADGRRTLVDWETDYGREGECHNTMGADWTVICDYNMRETGRVRFRVCSQDGAVDRECTYWTPYLSISTGRPA
ncbi:hypothetical protein [Streptomyces mayteni]